MTNAPKTTLMTPLTVKKAASSRRRSPGLISGVLVDEQAGDRHDAEPVEGADAEPEPHGNQRAARRRHVEHARPAEDAALAPAHGPRVEPLRAVDLHVEERVEEVEAGDPERHGGTEQPGLQRQLAGDGNPAADGRKAVDGAEPEVREPGVALEVGVDDEPRDGDRPQPAHQRVELPDGDEEDQQRQHAEHEHLGHRERARGELAAGRARVAGVDAPVDQAVQAHRQRPSADHGDGDPQQVGGRGDRPEREHCTDVAKGSAKTGCSNLTSRAKRAGSAGAAAVVSATYCPGREPGAASGLAGAARRLAGQQLDGVAERQPQHGVAVAAAAGRAEQVTTSALA